MGITYKADEMRLVIRTWSQSLWFGRFGVGGQGQTLWYIYTNLPWWGLQGRDGGAEIYFSSGSDLSVALLLFDPFLLAASLFPPQEYPGMDWILFVKTPLCLVVSGPHNQRETLFMNSY